MRRLRALSAGVRVDRRHFTGAVHSVFARACNIVLDDRRILVLLAPELGNAPHAVRLDAPAGFAFDRVLRPGAPAACRAGVLRAGGDALSARLADAVAWHIDLDGLTVDRRDPRVRSAWRETLRSLVRHERAAGAGRSGLPRRRVSALARALRIGDRERAGVAITNLIGCGAGLTPAGDDVVVGLLAGLRASAGSHRDQGELIDAIGESVRSALHRTNEISRAYLAHAMEGAFAEPLARLARSVATGAAREATIAEAGAALAVGATSGADGVRGLLLGFAARAPRPWTARRAA